MPRVSNEALNQFTTALEAATQRLGGGKVGLDSNKVRAAVREHRDAAYRYVELHCVLAASQPGYLQPAMIVASACHVEFGDPAPTKTVEARAAELNAQSVIAGIGFTPRGANPAAEPPERQAAREWWKKSTKPDGMCDACQAPLRRGEGFALEGRIMHIGEMKMNMGEELLCATCFERFRSDPREPGGGDDYFPVG